MIHIDWTGTLRQGNNRKRATETKRKLYTPRISRTMEIEDKTSTTRIMSASELQAATVHIFVPTIVLYVIIMLVGIVGNLLVLFIIGIKYKQSPHKLLLLSLAYFDSLGSFVCMPLVITQQVRYHDYASNFVCKFMYFIAHYIGLGSATTLLVIAIERHRMICKLLGKQISSYTVKVVELVIAVPYCCVMSLPAVFFWGVTEGSTCLGHYIGKSYICDFSQDFKNTPYPRIYEAILLLLIVSYAVAMVSLYFQIWRKIHNMPRLVRHRKSPQPSIANERQSRETTFGSKNTLSASTAALTIKGSIKGSKVAKLSFALTLLYFFSFIPTLSLNMLQAARPEFVQELSPSARTAFEFFYRTFIINYMANPFIYAFMDVRFQNQFKQLIHLNK